MTSQKFGGDWTAKKLNIFTSYLDAYLIALQNQKFNKIYIDAFAGTGEIETSDGEAYLAGSADLRFGERGLPGADHHSGKDGTNRGGAGHGAQRQKRRAAGLHDGHPGGASVGCLFHLPCQIYDHGRIL